MDYLNNLILLENIELEEKILYLDENTKNKNFNLTKIDIKTLIITKNNTLKSLKRMEIGESIILKIIEKLYTSPYLDNSNYLETLTEFIQIFYYYQQELSSYLTDLEILDKLILEFNDKGFIEENYLYLIKEEYETNR